MVLCVHTIPARKGTFMLIRFTCAYVYGILMGTRDILTKDVRARSRASYGFCVWLGHVYVCSLVCQSICYTFVDARCFVWRFWQRFSGRYKTQLCKSAGSCNACRRKLCLNMVPTVGHSSIRIFREHTTVATKKLLHMKWILAKNWLEIVFKLSKHVKHVERANDLFCHR